LWAAGAHAEYEFNDMRLERIADPLRSQFPPNQPAPSPERLRSAILNGMAMHSWRLESETPERMTIAITVREKHTARVELTPDARGFTIKYLDSTNLLFDEKTWTRQRDVVRAIHRNYNQWVRGLATSINTLLGVPGTSIVVGAAAQKAVAPAAVAPDVDRAGK